MPDTIYVAIRDTILSQQQLIDNYRELIHSQQTIFNIIIGAIVIIAGAIVTLNVYFNTKRIREIIRSDLRIEMQKDVSDAIQKVEKELTNESYLIKGEISRVFSITMEKEHPEQSLFWKFKALKFYILNSNKKWIRKATDTIMKDIGNIRSPKEFQNVYYTFSVNEGFEYLKDDISLLPDELEPEKKKMKEFLDKVFKSEKADSNSKNKTQSEDNK